MQSTADGLGLSLGLGLVTLGGLPLVPTNYNPVRPGLSWKLSGERG